jgi:hypothetical protein
MKLKSHLLLGALVLLCCSIVPASAQDLDSLFLSDQQFQEPIVWHVPGDSEKSISLIKSLTRPVDWFSQEWRVITGGCQENSKVFGMISGLRGVFPQGDDMERWAVSNGYIHEQPLEVKYTGYNGTHQYLCITSDKKLVSILPSKSASAGGVVLLGTRSLTKWTYRNTYTTQLYGKGEVKVFAGTFTYDVIPKNPYVKFSGHPSVTVKAYLDPDTGRWAVLNWQREGEESIELIYEGGNSKKWLVSKNEGTWGGYVIQTGGGFGNQQYFMKLTLNGDDGTVDYPELHCGGKLILAGYTNKSWSNIGRK